MSIVSISDGAKMVGRSRRTLQRHIAQGKLSKTTSVTGVEGVDISELIRVYGDALMCDESCDIKEELSRTDTSYNDMEIKHLKEIVEMQKEHIESLKKAMLLLEHKQEVEPKKKPWWRFYFLSKLI